MKHCSLFHIVKLRLNVSSNIYELCFGLLGKIKRLVTHNIWKHGHVFLHYTSSQYRGMFFKKI